MPAHRLKEQTVLDALRRLKGNLAAVAADLGVHRSTVWSFVNRRPALRAACHDAREEMVDHAESGLFAAISRGEAWAVCFCLKTQGRSRGYVERTELTGKDGVGLFDHLTDAELRREARALRGRLRLYAEPEPDGTTEPDPPPGGRDGDRQAG